MTNVPPKIVFFGTPGFAVYVLEELKAAGIVPTLLVTAPDKPRGRGLEVFPPEAKVWAQENNVDVLQPEKIRDAEFMGELGNTEWDLFIVAAFGKILPKELLDLPRHGTLNVHPSLLPKFRGPSPIQSQIVADERKTGVSIMLLDEEMDHGPLVAQASIEPEDWPLRYTLLEELLAREGGRLLAEVIPEWLSGTITPETQDHAKATFTKKITKEDGLLDLSADPYQNYLKYQAYYLWPGAFIFADRNGVKIRLKITDAEFSDGTFIVRKVIPEGKAEMLYTDYLRG